MALSNLMTLTFDPLTSKWVTGHPRHGLPTCQFQLPMPFRFWLTVRHGTDDGINV